MRITFQKRVGRLKVSLVIGTVKQVRGVNSTLANGKHIIMWEFDETDYSKVERWLWAAQAFNSLPAIHVARSHPDGGYHAYCLKACDWMETIKIVAGTQGVDPGYISMCAMRGHWTLRLTDKGQGAPQFIGTMPSGWPETVTPADMVSWVNYEVWSTKRVLTLGKRGI